ncbi:hypothetical protein [Phaeocystidibacter marisrubri]|uniref:Uncharacterized protein n=1 Tax=Phaeocystidibacter marisrubri TaxID=1577780 RepID=A0A6L3ZFW9_9FLAO|nr:hypothetical protein [Phaeocystidibacter marisrubri]KAB2815829.1 hypothetical protein F8C82_09020 [Phaeocystidibacter marisrubri]GGH65925.1 hypothetical protein GCM10011318_03390 [Phaeocystidibacter marisrubri]
METPSHDSKKSSNSKSRVKNVSSYFPWIVTIGVGGMAYIFAIFWNFHITPQEQPSIFNTAFWSRSEKDAARVRDTVFRMSKADLGRYFGETNIHKHHAEKAGIGRRDSSSKYDDDDCISVCLGRMYIHDIHSNTEKIRYYAVDTTHILRLKKQPFLEFSEERDSELIASYHHENTGMTMFLNQRPNTIRWMLLIGLMTSFSFMVTFYLLNTIRNKDAEVHRFIPKYTWYRQGSTRSGRREWMTSIVVTLLVFSLLLVLQVVPRMQDYLVVPVDLWELSNVGFRDPSSFMGWIQAPGYIASFLCVLLIVRIGNQPFKISDWGFDNLRDQQEHLKRIEKLALRTSAILVIILAFSVISTMLHFIAVEEFFVGSIQPILGIQSVINYGFMFSIFTALLLIPLWLLIQKWVNEHKEGIAGEPELETSFATFREDYFKNMSLKIGAGILAPLASGLGSYLLQHFMS